MLGQVCSSELLGLGRRHLWALFRQALAALVTLIAAALRA